MKAQTTGATERRYSTAYANFAGDVLCHGARFACMTADADGVPGATIAGWLIRMNLRRRVLPTLGSAAHLIGGAQ